MIGRDKRIHARTELPAKVKLMHPQVGELLLEVRDVSDGGIYVLCLDTDILPTGSEVKIQVVNADVETPVVEMKIVRKDADGMGMAFI